MTRAFYSSSRSHHAYCMAIDFGMKFKKRDGFWTPEGLLTITGAGGYKIEVAEESLGLLEPHDKDLVECEIDFDKPVSGSFLPDIRLYGGSEFLADLPNIEASLLWRRILRRSGIAFHWPEYGE